jgi:uncharacterized damage-inducible protein DinB
MTSCHLELAEGWRRSEKDYHRAMILADFLVLYRREHATTRKLLHAFPADQSGFKPHERSNSAHQLGWTFVVEEMLLLKALTGEPVLGSGFPPAPATWHEVLVAFDDLHAKVLSAGGATTDAQLRPVTFFVAPKQTGEYAPVDFLWFILSDQIHHRGQLSVYVRMAGGKVPSIYGPSADEPWF